MFTSRMPFIFYCFITIIIFTTLTIECTSAKSSHSKVKPLVKHFRGNPKEDENMEYKFVTSAHKRIFGDNKSSRLETRGSDETKAANQLPDGYFCPGQPGSWIAQESLIKTSDPPCSTTRWLDGDLFIERNAATNEYNCLQIQFATRLGIASVDGWSICGGNSGKSDGHIVQYIMLYRDPKTEQWATFQEGCSGSPKVFHVDVTKRGPTLEALEKPVIAREVMLCPMQTTGNHPLLHLKIKGCLLKKKANETASPNVQVSSNNNNPCISEAVWLDHEEKLQDCMFRTNAGGRPCDARFSQAGYPFPNIPIKIEKNKKYYLEVSFQGSKKAIQALKLMGGAVGECRGAIKQFQVSIKDPSLDGEWTFVRESDGVTDKIFCCSQADSFSTGCFKASRIPFHPPLVASAVRVYPRSWHGNRPVLKLDIKACDTELSDAESSD